jgi:MSHA biogenesis protein MshL
MVMGDRSARIWTGWLLLVLLAGCQSQPEQPLASERQMKAVTESAESYGRDRQQQVSQRNAQALDQALLGGVAGGSNEHGSEERFDLAVNNMPARDFFLSLVSGTGANIVVHPELEGSISLELNDVSIDEVLGVTRDIYGYEFKRSGSIYTIYARKLRTQIFSINYLDVRRVGVSDTSVQIGSVGSSDDNNNNNGGGGSNTNNAAQANLLGLGDDGGGNNQQSGNSAEGIVPGARIQTLNATDFWKTLKLTVEAIVGAEGNRMVMVNPQAGLVVVKAMPHELNAVRDFLERSELSVKRQVILETKILEVRLDEQFEAGINWNAISGQLLLGNNVTEFEQPAEIVNATDGVGEIFASLLLVNDITKLLSLLETQGSVQVLSSPRVSTVNNQKAVIRVGSDEYFVTGISSNTTSNASSTTNTPQIELSSFFSGIALDVTPQIADDGSVILHVHPVVSNVEDQLKDLTVGDRQFSIPLALREVRESDSIVRARSGQVVVLGGLMQENTLKGKGKRPWIGDVPVINSLFKTASEGTVKTELVILMRPIIVDNNDVWSNDIRRSNERVKSLGSDYRQLFER